MGTSESTAFKPPGYPNKPRWIYFAAFILMFAPLGNMIYSLATLGIHEWYKPHVWSYWAQYVSPLTWIVLSLVFLSGLSLLLVRTWTFALSVAILVIITIYDVVMFRQFEMMGVIPFLFMISGTLAFAILLYFTEFRTPYLNPRLRWWETSPRYRVDLPVTIANTQKPGTLVDVSRTGVLVEWADDKSIPDLKDQVDIILPTQVTLPVFVSRKTPKGYGLQFRDLTRDQKKEVKFFIETLAADPSKLQR